MVATFTTRHRRYRSLRGRACDLHNSACCSSAARRLRVIVKRFTGAIHAITREQTKPVRALGASPRRLMESLARLFSRSALKSGDASFVATVRVLSFFFPFFLREKKRERERY